MLLALYGIATLLTLLGLILSKRTSPLIALILVPIGFAVLAGHGVQLPKMIAPRDRPGLGFCGSGVECVLWHRVPVIAQFFTQTVGANRIRPNRIRPNRIHQISFAPIVFNGSHPSNSIRPNRIRAELSKISKLEMI